MPPFNLNFAPLLIVSMMSRFNREERELIAQAAIDSLDVEDGDPDIEPNGDELDGSQAEDDFGPQGSGFDGPGCPLADPDIGVDDIGEETQSEDSFWLPAMPHSGPGCLVSDNDCNRGTEC